MRPKNIVAEWKPEDAQFWESVGRRIAQRTLWLTTFALTLSFSTWFVWSAVVVYLNDVGFHLTVGQRFWLAAVPGLSGATWRIVHTFLILKFGTRTVVTLSTLSLLVPSIALGVVVQHPTTPYSILLLLAATAGFGGGNFSSFMPSTSLHFPRAQQGTALGIQAGIGNFGVSLVQFLVPMVIAVPVFGALGGSNQTWISGGMSKDHWLQNAGYIWVVPVLVSTLLNWLFLKNLPVRGSVAAQFVIFRRKHTWIMVVLYIMTFGSFSGLSASFPLLIKELFGGLPGGPNPLTYAFLGPLVGSAMRPIGGWLSDRIGGGVVTLACALILSLGAVAITFTTHPKAASDFAPFLALTLLLFFAAGIGNGSTFQQIPFIFPPREAGPVLGFTAAIAAYGSFAFPALFGWSLNSYDSPNVVYYGLLVFYLVSAALAWWYYARPGCEKPCKPAARLPQGDVPHP
ncbi:MAG: nitrate/nitrite transporter [Chloroflexota bacterium]